MLFQRFSSGVLFRHYSNYHPANELSMNENILTTFVIHEIISLPTVNLLPTSIQGRQRNSITLIISITTGQIIFLKL